MKKKVREFTLVVIKPDAVKKGLTDEIIHRLTKAGLTLVQAHESRWTKPFAMSFYFEHSGQPFYDRLVNFMSSGKSVSTIWSGKDAIKKVRDLIGPAVGAPKGTIRGDLGNPRFAHRNAVHASDSLGSYYKEVFMLFLLRNLIQEALSTGFGSIKVVGSKKRKTK